jgi:hypothetical protein
VVEIDSVHEIAGSVSLPPSPDLFILAAFTAFGSGRSLQVSPKIERSTCGAWQKLLETCLDFEEAETGLLVRPRTVDTEKPLVFPWDDMPYADYIGFLLLGKGYSLALPYAGESVLDTWKNWAVLAGCALECETAQQGVLLRLSGGVPALPSTSLVAANEIHPVLGLFHGRKLPVTMRIDAPWISPVRQMLLVLGFPCTCVSNTPRPPADPIARRIAQMQQAAKKQTETNPGFTLSADFSMQLSGEVLPVTLPGDDALGALLIGAKSLVQRGNLIIENLPAESWALQTLLFVRKMGCKIGEQVTGVTSFGQAGSLQLQRFDIAGRKTDCTPLFQFRSQLPMMVMIAAYANGQSIFRSLQILHTLVPDGITQIHACLDIIGVRHGEMPDGIVLDGGKRYDGFDMSASLSAPLAGACVVAALKCTGKSKINDEFILQRWPFFREMLAGICKTRE